ncbi:dihydroorotate dehydrogenase [Planctomycetota bacterium]|nr:dihydroorotate dehydrogenase [Planctomycetota bacterium]MSR37559.1 dihydroorotate dehydrogenase [Planctomycetota bacterium]GDY03789.1 dihydroorotate dehydrogenase [Planctomycetota bacterium]
MLETKLGSLRLANPVLSASGTYGSGWEGRTFSDLSRVGGLVSKTVTLRPRHGNPPPRIWETASGMLNSIGLENKGVEWFLADTLPKMRTLGPKLIINIGGETLAEFVQLAELFCSAGIDALEVNLSCPNVQEGKLLFSTDPRMTERTVAAVKRVANVPVFAKLSPNVTDITPIARAAEQGGADGITAINTLIGMAVDWRKQKPVLSRGIGGLSGPAIKPVALRMVHEVAKCVRIPIIGVGGARTAEDVLEFLCAGASAVEIGTASFVDPAVFVGIVDDLERLLTEVGSSVGAMSRSMLRNLPQPPPMHGRQAELPR